MCKQSPYFWGNLDNLQDIPLDVTSVNSKLSPIHREEGQGRGWEGGWGRNEAFRIRYAVQMQYK